MYHRQSQITTTVPNSNNRAHSRRRYLARLLVLIALALLPASQAETPPPGGAYPGFNTALGFNSLKVNDNTQGQFNTAIGFNALQANTTGDHNTAFGLNTLLFNTTGTGNMGIGGGCLRHNLIGNNNTAIGFQAMSNNLTDGNVAIGYQALFGNTTGGSNTAIGFQALFKNTDGADNNALGDSALFTNVSGAFNNAHGRSALVLNTSSENNAFGDLAMENNTTGASNTAIGDDALRNNTTGSFNVAVGDEAGTGLGADVNSCIAIGAPGDGPFAVLDNTCFIGSIFGEPVSDPGSQTAVFVDQFNVIGIFNSSRRVKHDIQPMDKSSETLYQLKPVTFKFNSDWKATTQYGLIAEEVEEVDPGLVAHGKDGETVSVHYEQINSMLLNEFLKEHKRVQALEATVALQQKGMEVLTAQLKEQAAQIQKVSAQIELTKRAPRTVANK